MLCTPVPKAGHPGQGPQPFLEFGVDPDLKEGAGYAWRLGLNAGPHHVPQGIDSEPELVEWFDAAGAKIRDVRMRGEFSPS